MRFAGKLQYLSLEEQELVHGGAISLAYYIALRVGPKRAQSVIESGRETWKRVVQAMEFK